MAPHHQQVGLELIAQLDYLFKGASYPEVGSSDGSSFLSEPFYLPIEDLAALLPKLTLYEGMCVGCVHIVPDVDQVKLRAAPSGDSDRGLGRLGRVLGAIGGQQYLHEQAVHIRPLSAPPLGRCVSDEPTRADELIGAILASFSGAKGTMHPLSTSITFYGRRPIKAAVTDSRVLVTMSARFWWVSRSPIIVGPPLELSPNFWASSGSNIARRSAVLRGRMHRISSSRSISLSSSIVARLRATSGLKRKARSAKTLGTFSISQWVTASA